MEKLDAIQELIESSKEAEMLIALGNQVKKMIDSINYQGGLSSKDIQNLQDMSKKFGDSLENEMEKRKRIEQYANKQKEEAERKKKEEERKKWLKDPNNWKPQLYVKQLYKFISESKTHKNSVHKNKRTTLAIYKQKKKKKKICSILVLERNILSF